MANRAGRLGALVAAGLNGSVGLASYLLVVLVAAVGARLLAGFGLPSASSRLTLAIPLLLLPATTLPPLLGAALPRFAGLDGGALGELLARNEMWVLGSWGALLANALAAAIGALAVTSISLERAIAGLGLAVATIATLVFSACAGAASAAVAGARAASRAVVEIGRGIETGWRSLGVWRERRARRMRVAAQRERDAVRSMPRRARRRAPSVEGAPRRARRARRRRRSSTTPRSAPRAMPGRRASRFASTSRTGRIGFPTSTIFQDPPRGTRVYDRDSLIMNSRILEKKLQDFGVGGSVVKVHPGPVVTMYEFEPASGIKVQRIVNLADDLALALRALSVRIIAPLPGQVGGGRRGRQRGARDRLPARAAREREVPRQPGAAPRRARQGHLRQPRRRGSRAHAAPARRGRDGHGQERVPELAAVLDPVPRALPTS